jgi:dienelactone hydrolase
VVVPTNGFIINHGASLQGRMRSYWTFLPVRRPGRKTRRDVHTTGSIKGELKMALASKIARGSNMRATFVFVISLIIGAASVGARAQTVEGDLTFPTEARTLSFFTPLSLALFKPEGEGPFPAVVIFHSCGGLRSEIHDWVKASLAQGYVALVIDALEPRGVQINCYPPLKVSWSRLTKDAFDALEHLRKLSFVDSKRIGLIGFSQGAMVGFRASSAEVAKGYPAGDRFAAVASLYGGCPGFLRYDTDRPLLALMGELDNETPPSACVPILDGLKSVGAPVEWHIYPGTTHCWDCRSLHNLSKRDWRGTSVVYYYDRVVTEDSVKRVFTFFDVRMKRSE